MIVYFSGSNYYEIRGKHGIISWVVYPLYPKKGVIMGCKRIANNKYKIIVDLGYDEFGNRQRKSETFYGTAAEAKVKEAELIKKYYHKGNVSKGKDLTFEELSKNYLEYCRTKHAKRTVKKKKDLLKEILPLIGKVKLTKITTPMLSRLYIKLTSGERKEKRSSVTMLEYYKLINAMFNYAIDIEQLLPVGSNPNINKLRPKVKKQPRKFYDIPTSLKFLSCLKNECIKYQALLLMGIEIGDRCGEQLALRWGDIDWENGRVLIDNSLGIIEGEIDEDDTKTDDSKRTHYISNATLDVLREYKKWQDEQIKKLGDEWIGTDRIFTQRDGNPMNNGTPLKTLQKVQLKYGLPKTTFHELRHTSASIKMYKGIDINAISDMQGTSKKLLMELYCHVFDDAKKESARIFDELIRTAMQDDEIR